MNAKHDADDHLAVVRDFMDGKQARETRRTTRDLGARINPITLTTALAAVLPHVAKDDESGNHFVGLVFTPDNLLLVASSGWSVIVCKSPAVDGARVTGDVVADSVIMTPVMAKQLMGFAGLTPKNEWDPQFEVEVAGTGPESLRLRATDRTGLFEGKSITLPVQEPTKNLAQAAQILESMASATTAGSTTDEFPLDPLTAFLASAKKWGADLEVEAISPVMWRVRCSTVLYGLITSPVHDDDQRTRITSARNDHREQWRDSLTGVGQELVRGFQ